MDKASQPLDDWNHGEKVEAENQLFASHQLCSTPQDYLGFGVWGSVLRRTWVPTWLAEASCPLTTSVRVQASTQVSVATSSCWVRVNVHGILRDSEKNRGAVRKWPPVWCLSVASSTFQWRAKSGIALIAMEGKKIGLLCWRMLLMTAIFKY